MYPAKNAEVRVSQYMAWCNNVYAAVANATGYNGVYTYFGDRSVIGFGGRTLSECKTEEMGIQYAKLSVSQIRDSRTDDQTKNHLYKLLHRDYTGTIESGENRYGEPKCQYSFYADWIKDPEAMQKRVEGFNRKSPAWKALRSKKFLSSNRQRR